MISRRRFVESAAVAILAAPLVAEGQPSGKVPRVGVLRIGAPIAASDDALRQGLRDLGYAEGQNILIEDRWAAGRLERLPELAADLVRLPVDLIVAGGVAGHGRPHRRRPPFPL